MEAQTKASRAFDLWLLDLALTATSFFLAYRVRAAVDLRGHTVMPLRVYLPTLFIMLPVWAIVLPLFRVYSRLTMDPLDVLWRLAKAIGAATLAAGFADFIVSRMQLLTNHGSSRLLLSLTAATSGFLLLSYRLLLLRKDRYRAAGGS